MKNSRMIQGFRSNLTLKLVALWLASVLMVWTLALVIAERIPQTTTFEHPRSAVNVLSEWDGEHYAIIAADGYSIDGEERRRLAFFPLLPTVARFLGGVFYSNLAGILLSQLCFLGCILLINRIFSEDKLPETLRHQPGFWLLVSPLSFFFLVFYAESLYLFLTLLMIFASRREHFKTAVALGILVGLTRPTAICLPVIFLWWAAVNFRHGKNYAGLLMCAISPLLGLLLYFGAVGYLVGEPLAYFHIQSKWWTSQPAIPFVALFADLKGSLLALSDGKIYPVDIFVRLFSSIVVIILIIWGWRKCDTAFWLYLVVGMIFIHSQEPHRSTARYELVLFPVYFLISKAMGRYPRLSATIAAASIIIQIMLFIRYSAKLWVA
ncbi:MAG: hypothetical protein ACR2N3_18015 [Pyrinomonadaceae bacterium]